MKRQLLFCLAIICSVAGTAQETLVPLSSRSELHELNEKQSYKKSAAADTMELPFFDDFSDYFNKKFDNYYWPDAKRWVDRQAFVNDNLPNDPMSVGVVTLDGVDILGQPYNWLAGNAGASADTLTSVPLKLDGKSNVILSFYYQAGGISTYSPEFGDRLVLEFKDLDTVWTEMWATNGIDDDSTFFRAMVPIDSAYHLYDGFQFRFRNYATLHTNGDFWHLDYIELDADRIMDDTLTNDLSLLYKGESLLAEYSSMPWKHFKEDPAGNMGDKVYIRVRNGHADNRGLDFFLEALNVNGGVDFAVPVVNASTVLAEDVCGSLEQDCNDNVFTNITSLYGTGVDLSEDSAYFLVRKWLTETGDVRTENDTVVYVQEFYNYYAYDDGTAEVAYGLGNIEDPGSVAVKYDVKKADALLGVQIYFDPVKWNLTDEFFQLQVWSGDSIPEELIAQSDTIYPEYTVQNVFHHYFFDEPVEWDENPMFIGWKQQANPDITFTVGFDLQTDRSEKLFYNLGSNWIQSSIPGSVMIRPVFGDPYTFDPASVDEVAKFQFTVFPNPATYQLKIRSNSDLNGMTARILDIAGRELKSYTNLDNLNISKLTSGIYMLVLQHIDGSVAGNSRIIKQ
ncbi:MAG: hypothetical protein ACI9FU_000636 [Granulosicoccus sp.]|jgi:hypothetical protein